MPDIALRVENLKKRYRIGQRERYKSLRDSLANAFAVPFRRLASFLTPDGPASNGDQRRMSAAHNPHIWALQDVSFEVKRGEVVGIIGRNGAGKSTLLKILSRITEPTQGQVEIHGRVGSLLEVGTGFHPELTGRENIYLNGAILGMKRLEISRKFDEIVAFAEVEKFIDTPVKHYSSGMYMRLAFAVAAHLEPEILVVDEVLAVGDAEFQKKCLGKMGEVAEGGRTVLLVSHNMGAIKSLSSTVLWLEHGQVREMGESRLLVNHYLANAQAVSQNGYYDMTYIASRRLSHPKYVGHIRLQSVSVKTAEGHASGIYAEGSEIFLELEFSASSAVDALEVFVRVKNVEGQLLFTGLPGKKQITILPGIYRAVIRFSLQSLLPGMYQGDVVILSNIPQDSVNPAFEFEIIPDPIRESDARTVFLPSTVSSPAVSSYAALGVMRADSGWQDFFQVD